MIKKLVLIFFFLPFLISAQVKENDWINYSQNYFKFPIYSNGVYKITYQELLNSGINVTNINPKNIQIFHKGEEQHIYIQGENDGVFDPADYLEFYAEKNDGTYDANLLLDSLKLGNPEFSMFTDTSYYFLTWNLSESNKRLAIETDVNYNAYSPVDYFWSEVIASTSASFQSGELTYFNWAVPEFSEGAGFGSKTIAYGASFETKMATPFVYLSGPQAKIITNILGGSLGRHDIRFRVNSQLNVNQSFNGYSLAKFNQDFDPVLLQDNTTVRITNLLSTNNTADKTSVMYLKMRYPRMLNLGNSDQILFYLQAGLQSKDLLNFSNFNNRNSTTWLYDLSQNKKIVVQPNAGTFSTLVTNNGSERKCFLTSEAVFRKVDKIIPVSGTSSFFTNYKNLATLNGGANYFIVSASHLLDAANEYAAYRSQNGHQGIVFDIQQLYDQYAYGIRKHPMAIRNLMIEAYNEWTTKPKNLLLLGKSVSLDVSRSGAAYTLNALPTWGPLGTDIGFTSYVFGASVLDPLVPTGRIAAINSDQARSYLNKVKAYEQAETAEWMKNILHFGGGANLGEQTTFASYLKSYESIAESPYFGGNVHTFLKSSSDPLQINLSDSVTNLVNNGVTLMTFFGHAYSGNFDQSIDEPENYTNTGKYGFILANSCLIGNIHTSNNQSGSERFVLAKDKGTIGFIGSSSLGVPSYLNAYTSNFYKNLFKDNYGKSVGEIIKQTIITIQDSSNNLSRDVCMHMTLHGDPSLVLNIEPKVDYTLFGETGNAQPRVFFNPAEVTNEVDSFSVNVVIANIGKAQKDTFDVIVNRKFPDNTDTTYTFTVNNIYFKDTLSFNLPVDLTKGIGLNVFDVQIDALNVVSELSELNNNGSVNLFIKSSDVTPVYPYEYAVVPNQFTTLKAFTSDSYAGLKNYVLQIDTTDKFDSPILTQDTIQSIGGVIEWDPNLYPDLKSFYNKFSSENDLSSPRVYFWRISPTIESGLNVWKSSSFQYVKGKSGWGQSHFYQFKKNNFEFLDYNYNSRKYAFTEQVKTLEAAVHSSYQLPYRAQTGYKIDGAIVCHNSSTWAGLLLLAVIDKTTLKPWHVHEHGNRGHMNYIGGIKLAKDWNEFNFYYSSGSATHVDSITSFLKSVPDSNYILMYHFQAHNLKSWYSNTSSTGLNFKNQMNLLGADTDSMLKFSNSAPYLFFTQKGDPSKTIESFSTGGSLTELIAPMRNNWLDGTMSSVLIGPAKTWNSFHWEVDEGELGNLLDTNKISLYAIDQEGKEIVYLDTLIKQGDVLDLSNIDANLYPYLRIKLYLNDDLNRTPNRLKRWQILFDEIPEAAINPIRLASNVLQDTLQQGELLTFETAIENITNIDMDSIQVAYWLVDDQYNIFPKTFKMLKPLKGGSFLLDTITVETSSLKNINSLWYEFNPYDGPKPWQLEKHHFNNVYKSQFQVNLDKINPILDVTFDGVHILDGDIVSSVPQVVITLDDENQFFALDDKSLVQVFVNYPSNSGSDSLVLLKENEYNFSPASLPKNKAKIEFLGSFPKDGKYDLRVMAKDRSNNISGKGDGTYDYRISFEVINESTITQLINWPNPFSTSTQFVFILTGSVIPSDFLIQITTISGKVVREINKDELGTIHIGRNISEFKWDGTDQFGDKLANGVYLYRVIVKNNGESVKERSVTISDNQGTSTLSDKYFQKGFGKIYILR